MSECAAAGCAGAASGATVCRIMIFCQIFCERPAVMRSMSLTASVTTGSGNACA